MPVPQHNQMKIDGDNYIEELAKEKKYNSDEIIYKVCKKFGLSESHTRKTLNRLLNLNMIIIKDNSIVSWNKK